MRSLHDSIKRVTSGRGWHAAAIPAAVMWLLVIIPSGVNILVLLVFTAPAAALGLFMRWLSCAFVRARWSWDVGLQAAIVSAMLMPPLLAALVTIVGLQRPEQLLTLFVLGAWIALAAGLIIGALTFTNPRETAGPTQGHASSR
jgi:hypothetical protein